MSDITIYSSYQRSSKFFESINFEYFANLGPYKGFILPDGLYSIGLFNFFAEALKLITNFPS